MNDYAKQLDEGIGIASGNIMAEAGQRGFSAGLQRQGGQMGGEMRAQGVMQKESLRRQMELEMLMAQFDQSRRANEIALQRESLYNTFGAAQAGVQQSAYASGTQQALDYAGMAQGVKAENKAVAC